VPYDCEATWLAGYNTGSTLYTFIASLNQIRNRAVFQDSTYVTYKAVPSYSDTTTIVLRKGQAGAQIVAVFSNKGASGSSYTQSLSSSVTGFSASQALIKILSCTAYTVDSSGNLAVAMASGLPRILYPTAGLTGSGICPGLTGTFRLP
jgi:alpha-amylase